MAGASRNFLTSTVRVLGLASLAIVATATMLPAANAAAGDVEVAMHASPDPVRPGEKLWFTATFANRSGASASNWTITATVPSFTFVSAEEDSGALCDGFVNSCGAGGTLSWAVPSLAAGESRSVMFAATVATGSGAPPDGTVLQSAATATSSAGSDSASAQVVVRAIPPMSLGIVESQDPVVPSGLLTYTLQLGNLGAVVSPAGTLEFEAPAGTTLVSATGGGSLVGDKVQWNVAGMAAGASNRYGVVVQVGAAAIGGDILEAVADYATGGTSVAGARVTTVVAAAPGATVEVSASPDPVRPGEKLWVTVTFANRTAAQVNNWTVSATVPQYTTVLSDEDSGALCDGFVNSCGPGETLTWTVPSLAAGESRSVMFAATVATGSGTPPDGKLLRTEARVRSALPGEVSASAQVVVDATPTVSLGMVESADPVLPGSVLSYAIELGNLGGTVSPSGVLKMELAEGTTFVSATGGGSHASGVVQWNVSGIAAGASNRYQVFVQTAPGLQGGDLLEAGLEFGVGAASIARAEVVTSVVAAAPGATVEVSASPDPVRPGEKLWVTVTFANRTAAQVNNWTVSATVPQYTTVFSDEDSGALCNGFVNSCGPGETLTWTVPSLAAGESRSVMFAATVATGSGTPLDGTVLRTTAKATSDLPGEVSGSADVVVDSTPSVDLSVVESADPVVAGESLTYVLLLGNRGSVPSPAGVLTLRLPQGTTFVLASDGGTHATGIVQWNVSGIAAGASNRYEVVVQTSSAATAGDLLEADAEFSVGVASLARAQTATSVVGVPSGTTLLVTGAPDPVRPGERVWFTVTFANRTAAQVNNWTVSATVPQYTTVLSDEDSGALCNGFVNSCGPGGTLTWTVPSLAAGESRSVMFAATVAIGSGTPPDGTVLRTSAKVTSDLAGEVSAIADVLVDASPQMTLGIVESRDPAVVGEPIAYTLALANRGTLASDAGTLTLALPSGTTFVSATGGGSLAGNVVQWSVGSLAAGTGYSYQVVLQVGAGALAAGVIEAAADFSTGAASLARADVATSVAATPPGAVVTMTAAPDPVKPAERVTFTVTFQNQTLAPVNNWTVAATVPQYTTVLAGEDSGALCNGFDNSCGAGGTLTWAVPTLTAGESRVVTFAALVNGGSSAPPNGTLLSSTATVTSDLPGEVSAGAEVIASTVPPPPPPGDVALVSAASRKVHGAAGTFDLPLVLTTASPTTEPRTGGAGGNHTIVFVFDQPVTSGTAAVTAGTGTAGTPTFSGNAMSVPLAGVVNQQYVTVAVSGLNGTAAGASVRIGFLLGDVSQNRVVTVSDLAQVNTQIAQVVTASNYLRDVNASGTLTVADKGIANTQITKALPAP